MLDSMMIAGHVAFKIVKHSLSSPINTVSFGKSESDNFSISVIFLRAESANHIKLLFLEQRLLDNQKFHYI
jgi:hypothetical protein